MVLNGLPICHWGNLRNTHEHCPMHDAYFSLLGLVIIALSGYYMQMEALESTCLLLPADSVPMTFIHTVAC